MDFTSLISSLIMVYPKEEIVPIPTEEFPFGPSVAKFDAQYNVNYATRVLYEWLAKCLDAGFALKFTKPGNSGDEILLDGWELLYYHSAHIFAEEGNLMGTWAGVLKFAAKMTKNLYLQTSTSYSNQKKNEFTKKLRQITSVDLLNTIEKTSLVRKDEIVGSTRELIYKLLVKTRVWRQTPPKFTSFASIEQLSQDTGPEQKIDLVFAWLIPAVVRNYSSFQAAKVFLL